MYRSRGFDAGRALRLAAVLGLLGASPVAAQSPVSAPRQIASAFAGFDLPDEWEARFWDDPGVKALLALEPKALAEMVPLQAGLRYCRCPACDSEETDDTLSWSAEKPEVVTCRACGASMPDDKFPVKGPVAPGQPPGPHEESIEVLPRVQHTYPYHPVDPVKQRYPDERIYLAAKRDYEAKEFLSKLALYAAVRHHERPSSKEGEPDLGLLAAVLVLRFAQVYPAYATHYDQPGQPKIFQQADLQPPYRHGYRTAKWDWAGCLDVPLNLLIAYALVRDSPALTEAGKLLDDVHPARTIEDDLFRASARFVRDQPEEYQESSLLAYRGMLAVGRLVGDETLVTEALTRLDGFAERAFYHDGLWRHGDALAHRRVVGMVDGWIGRMMDGQAPSAPDEARPGAIVGSKPGAVALPILALARRAGDALILEEDKTDVQLAAWPVGPAPSRPRGPKLLGGAGLARLAVGEGADALEIELRGMGDYGWSPAHRLALRVAVGGVPVLGDLDERSVAPRGFDRATASHNAVLIDGLNQRESFEQARVAAPGSDILYFAADPDFQVATLDDRYAYPTSATRYRQTIVACAGPQSRYALSIFEVRGGSQHDQLFHARPGASARWRLSTQTAPGPPTLLPPNLPFVATARPDDGRWFVQSLGEFGGLESGRLETPGQALLAQGDGPGVRLHLVGDLPAWVIAGASTDPESIEPDEPGAVEGRAALVVRRRSEDGQALATTFATLIEPVGASFPLRRVGRLAAPEGVVALAIESADGLETVVYNPTPGQTCVVELLDGRLLRTDGLVARVVGSQVMLAGGTFVEVDGVRADQDRALGTIVASGKGEVAAPDARGWFETAEPLPEPDALTGRALIVRHGDGTCRAWTVARAVNRQGGGARIEVVEVPGFRIDAASGEAVYYQFPRTRAPGPHSFRIARIARSR